jgi:hypothetical protein
MLGSRLHSWHFVILAAMAGLAIPAATAIAEVHGLCPVLSGQLRGTLGSRNGMLLDQIVQQLGSNAGGAQQAINAARNAVNYGTLTGVELADLTNAARAAAAPEAQAKINVAIAKLAVNQQVLLWLRNAPLGATAVPTGRNVPIALVSGIPLLYRGRIVPLGFGPVLIGIDQPSDAIVLGEGNVDEVAAEVLGDNPANVPVTLANVGSTAVNYTVNQQPFNMPPNNEQNLTGGANWIVAFDRGGGNGTAEYQLAEGYYEFTLTPKGWELFQKQAPTAAAPPAATSAYAQAAGIRLPPGFKMFDPIPALTGTERPQTAQLPEHFSLFRSAAERLAQVEPIRK